MHVQNTTESSTLLADENRHWLVSNNAMKGCGLTLYGRKLRGADSYLKIIPRHPVSVFSDQVCFPFMSPILSAVKAFGIKEHGNENHGTEDEHWFVLVRRMMSPVCRLVNYRRCPHGWAPNKRLHVFKGGGRHNNLTPTVQV